MIWTDHTGEKAKMKCGVDCTITKYNNFNDIEVQFETGEIVESRYDQFREGGILCPSVGRNSNLRHNHVGERNKMKCGKWCTITKYTNNINIDVTFDSGEVVTHKTYQMFRKGGILCPGSRLSLYKGDNRIGERHQMKTGLWLTITGYENALNVIVKFGNGCVREHLDYRQIAVARDVLCPMLVEPTDEPDVVKVSNPNLSGKSYYQAIMNKEDVDLLGDYLWGLDGGGYMFCKVGGKSVKLHREVLLNVDPNGVSDKVDHINRNRLDNRRCNLRWATHLQNVLNSSLPVNNTTGYRGVSFDSATGKWVARFNHRTVGRIRLGYYDTKEEAARAYDEGTFKYRDPIDIPFCPLNLSNTIFVIHFKEKPVYIKTYESVYINGNKYLFIGEKNVGDFIPSNHLPCLFVNGGKLFRKRR